jgi:hypothetical protein
MDVYLFLSVYPYPVGTQTSGVTCTFSTWANNANWSSFVASGELKAKAEEFLFMLYIGSRAAGEHPPSCFEAVIGPPSFITSNYEHGPKDDSAPTTWKTIEWYTRNLPVVPPSHPVPEYLQRPRPSHANSDVSMVLRSTMSPSFAKAHTACWTADPATAPDAGRPAWMVAPGYAAHRRQMMCNFAAFAAQFTPMVTAAELARSDRSPLLVAVPIGMGDELCALVPLKHSCFAVPLQPGIHLLEQMQALTTFLPQDEQPQQMHVTRDKHGDVVFALPFVEKIVGGVAKLEDMPRRRNLRAAWVTYAALTPGQFEHTALAMERCRSFVTAVPWMRANVGVTNGPVPVTPHRASAAFRGSSARATATAEWKAFLRDERAHATAIYEAFEAEDGGSGILQPFIGNINTAATRAADLVPPAQGLPHLDAATYCMLPYPDPPMPLHTSYLARVPPQCLPEGFPDHLNYSEVVRGWGRRKIAAGLDMNWQHDLQCYRDGWSDRPRHPFLCLGPGAFHSFHFNDGVGSICLNQILLQTGDDGLLRPMHFEYMDHKDLEAIIGTMGFSSDKELLSFLIHGARWKVAWPRQIRISHSVFSLKSRAKGVAEATAKLIDAGLYIATALVSEGEHITETTTCPLATCPQYSTGMGGADKTDKPWEKRPCGNTSDPHTVIFEQNKPHGPPDGPRVLSVNDMTGLKKYPPGFNGYIPFPDPETKIRSREVYAAEAVVGAMAKVNGTTPAASKDDVRWMFFQINQETCEFWIQVQYLTIATCTKCGRFEVSCACVLTNGKGSYVLILYKVVPRVTNMGSRPASKIAVRFSKQLSVEWRDRMADYVHAIWLPEQSEALRNLLMQRERTLGYEQAHPFWCCEFTDDFLDITCDIPLTAVGARVRREIAAQINLWMSSKAEAGTCIDYIGGRHLIAGGFGTLAPHKRVRCYEQCSAAIAGALTLDEFTAHNSFLVHARDLLDFHPTLLEGIWAPVHHIFFGTTLVDLSSPPYARVRENYETIRFEVATRPAASFACGFFDAPRGASATSPGGEPVLYLHMSSDCMANGVTTTIFGALMEYEWKLSLSEMDARWARRHINVGESTGAAVNVAVFGVPFAMFELIQGGDNRAEGPMLLGRSKSKDQRIIGSSMRETAGYKACADNLWFEHNSGLGLGFTDGGSRDYSSVLDNLAAAFGRRRTRIDATAVPGVLEMLSTILEGTSDYVKPLRVRHSRRVTFTDTSASALRCRPREEVGDGVCPSAQKQNSASQKGSLSPTPDRPVVPPPSPPAHRPAFNLSPSPTRRPNTSHPESSQSGGRSLSPTPPRASSSHLPRARARSSPIQNGEASSSGYDATRSDSPQPLTAAAARAAAAIETADQVVASSSLSSAHPAAARDLRALCAEAHRCEMEGIPRGTRGHDEWGFKWVRTFGEVSGLRWMRPRYVPPHLHHIESRFAALALYYIVPEMKPAARTLAKGIDQAKPPSGMLAIYGWRRVMRDCGRHEPDMAPASRILRGLIEQLKQRCGQDAMAPDHHIPYPLQSILRAVKYLDTYSNPAWTASYHDSLALAIRFNLARGPRIDEWCEMYTGDSYYRRGNFSWMLDSVLLEGALLDIPSAGLTTTFLRVTNVPSKTDRSGAKWIGKFMWYRARSSDPLNIAHAWAKYELKYPCPASQRRTWAAFSPSGDAPAFKPTPAREALKYIWTAVEGAAFAAAHVWHDFRATIATACAAAKKSAAFIQAAVCWASPKSVALYGQLQPSELADAADCATSIDASRHAHIEIPHVAPETVLNELEKCMPFMLAGEGGTTSKSTAPGKMKPAKRRASAPLKARPPRQRASPNPPPATLTSQPETPASSPLASPLPAPTAHTPLAGSASAADRVYDVGPPLHHLTLQGAHPLDGVRVSVFNSVWSAGAGGRSWCTIQGYAAEACLDGHTGAFVLTADDDGAHYAFTLATLRPCLTAAAKRRLEASLRSAMRDSPRLARSPAQTA